LAALGNAGGILMPWVVGWLGDLASLHWGLAVSAFAPLLMMPLVFLLKGPARAAVALAATTRSP
jgi:hypothetical protein